MRDIVLVGGIIVFLGIAIRYPFAGLLTWAWLAIMNPHQLAYGFARGAPLNSVVAMVTIGAWIFSKEKGRWPRDPLPLLMLAFLAWMSFNSFFAADPAWSWPLWDRTVKIYVFVFLAMVMMRTKVRIHGIIWVLVISLGFFGAKGGVFTIVSGGAYRVYGPDNTIISDNNHMAAAVVMILPLVYYLLQYSQNAWMRLGLKASFPLLIATVLGSYSRGGVIALAVMSGFFWLRSRHKILILVVGALVVGATLSIMPASFYERMDSVKDASRDDSFMGRIISWQVCYRYAVDHFPFGAGYAGTQQLSVYNYYFPGADPHAAHSIYFQVLGEHGFPGLLLYLLIAAQALRNTRLVVRRCRKRPEMSWAGDLAAMVEVALIGFYVGGAALSLAYYDGFLLLQALTSVLRDLTEEPRTYRRRDASSVVPVKTPDAISLPLDEEPAKLR